MFSSTNRSSSALAEAQSLHQQGRLQEAEVRYAAILASEPGNLAARYHQGLVRLQRGDLDGGTVILRQLLKRAPEHVEAHFNLGRALLERGKEEKALTHFKRTVALAPNVAEAYFYLGLTLVRLHRQAESLAAFEKAIELRPDLAEAHLNLGNVLNELGRFEPAIAYFERALALKPKFAEAFNGLGNCLRSLARLREADTCFRKAIALKPEYAEPHQGLGMALNDLGRYDEACSHFKQAIVLRPDFVFAFTGWGHALHEMGQINAARACWEKAIELEPKDAAAHAGLGNEFSAANEHTKALASFKRALRLDDKNVTALHGLGGEMFSWGGYAEGLAYLEKAVALVPENFMCRSGLLFNLHYHPRLSAVELASRHRAVGEDFEATFKSRWIGHGNLPDPVRPLRVGFVSGDFRRHPVGYFMADLIPNLKLAGLELYAYANQWKNDDLTERIKPQFAAWRECRVLSDDAMAEQIRADGVDVLVDLSGHSAGTRLLAFARKPAPVQVTYLGYPDTTGLTAIDYILGDPRMFPAGEENLYAEKPWCLPDTSLCFTPPDLPVEVGPLPALDNGFVTFGCLNKAEKASNEAVTEIWAGILHAVPGSRLLLQNKTYSDAGIAALVYSRFAEQGIEADRLELVGKLSWREHLEAYNRVDIALDPFPYNGTTTSVEGLWMGVPLLGLKGDRLVAHMGESILHTMGMTEWIAADKAEYVTKAVAFAANLPALAGVRAGLRQRLLGSPICDAPRFARNLEEAFRGMWRAWCEQQPPPKQQ
jgi:predicted O-linked N-acetylglucosamine transferase (SPINDLY family)